MKEYIVDVDGYIEDYEIEVHCPDWAKEKIVRCRDCKYFSDIAFLSCDFFTDVYGNPSELLDDKGFCAWGEPKVKKQTELKPCPFCGGEAIIEESKNGKLFAVYCNNDDECNVHAFTKYFDTKEEVAKIWNTRADRTTKVDDNGHCECGTLVRWIDNCEPYETSDGLIAYKSIHPPVTRYYDYCPTCGAKVVK